jgi:hypothetical protein
MGWIAIVAILGAVFIVTSLVAGRTHASRRNDRLESAFTRARGQRLTTNGIRTDRF